MTVNECQFQLKNALSQKFNVESVIEWRTQMKPGLYSPRVDIALGPFAIEDGLTRTVEHNNLFDNNITIIEMMAKYHLENLGIINEFQDVDLRQSYINEKVYKLLTTNYNGRCFLAIEIENNVTRKHLMGGAINASVLGKIGIAAGFNEEKHRAFLNLYRYFQFLQEVGKPTFNTNNLMVISTEQLLEIAS